MRDPREQIAALAQSLRLWRNLSLGLCGFTLAIALFVFARSGSNSSTVTSPANENTQPATQATLKELRDRLALLEAAKPAANVATPAGDVISARRFEVKGKDGRVQAVFEAADDGSTSVRLLNDKGDSILSMASSQKGVTNITLSDATGRPRCILAVLDNGTPRMVLTDTRGAERLSAMIDPQGASHLVFFDQTGRNRGSLSAPATAAPGFYLRDAATNLRAALTLVDGNRTALTFFDSQQRRRGELRVTESGSVALELADPSALTRVLLGTTSAGDPVLRFSDENEKVLFTAPAAKP